MTIEVRQLLIKSSVSDGKPNNQSVQHSREQIQQLKQLLQDESLRAIQMALEQAKER